MLPRFSVHKLCLQNSFSFSILWMKESVLGGRSFHAKCYLNFFSLFINLSVSFIVPSLPVLVSFLTSLCGSWMSSFPPFILLIFFNRVVPMPCHKHTSAAFKNMLICGIHPSKTWRHSSYEFAVVWHLKRRSFHIFISLKSVFIVFPFILLFFFSLLYCFFNLL